MKTIELTTIQHPQSGKAVDGITILGETYVFADKRGYTHRTAITEDFARQIISAVPAKHYYDNRMHGSYEIIWSMLTDGSIELRMFSCGSHVFTSESVSAR